MDYADMLFGYIDMLVSFLSKVKNWRGTNYQCRCKYNFHCIIIDIDTP